MCAYSSKVYEYPYKKVTKYIKSCNKSDNVKSHQCTSVSVPYCYKERTLLTLFIFVSVIKKRRDKMDMIPAVDCRECKILSCFCSHHDIKSFCDRILR